MTLPTKRTGLSLRRRGGLRRRDHARIKCTFCVSWCRSFCRLLTYPIFLLTSCRMAEEMEQASVELKARRRAKLRELYAQLEQKYEKQLNERGMSFIRERD